jgi:hypothetical protein
MADWTRLDDQVHCYSPYLRDEFHIVPPQSNALATTVAREIRALPSGVVRAALSGTTVGPKDRLDELVAFQSFMDLAHATPSHPGLTRAQVVTQN